jgi:hypothetical protein
MQIETRFDLPDGYLALQWNEWELMFAYDFFGWRLGFGYRDMAGPSFSLNLLCFDIHLHR